ncbi:MAG: DUF1559 domain-containing protein [Planctomycetaceae bacterium]|nr:DUF1559 domain-containing protein [Planctomycetaceae bacterium]
MSASTQAPNDDRRNEVVERNSSRGDFAAGSARDSCLFRAVLYASVVGFLCWFLMPHGCVYPKSVAWRTQSRQNLRQIGLAFHNYHDAYSSFPEGPSSEPDAGTHSWQTKLLPHLDYSPLYSSVNLEKSRSDEANRPTFEAVVPEYRHPHDTEQFRPLRGYALSSYAASSRVVRPDAGMTYRKFIDGTSNTILAGEVAAGFKPWGDPGNVRDPAAGVSGSVDGFGGRNQRGPQMLFVDGSVKTIHPKVAPKVLRSLATPDGGEKVDWDDVDRPEGSTERR